MNWDKFLAPYKQAVQELDTKLNGMRLQFENDAQHSPIESVTGRVKPISSILEKAKLKNIPLNQIEEKIQDIGGIRIVCHFVDDIYTVVNLLRARHDFTIIEEKDYIEKNKESGYRSYHMIIHYPVETIHGVKLVQVEIQIRTLAMNFWAVNEHSLNYKYSGEIPSEITRRLKRAAEAAFKLDEEMSIIKNEILEARRMFRRSEREEQYNQRDGGEHK